MSSSRRHFIVGLGAAVTASALPSKTLGRMWEPPLYPVMDLSYFDYPITAAPGMVRFGYAAITWHGNDEQAVKEISELGLFDIQLRRNNLKDYSERPKALRDRLDQNHLDKVNMSRGRVDI